MKGLSSATRFGGTRWSRPTGAFLSCLLNFGREDTLAAGRGGPALQGLSYPVCSIFGREDTLAAGRGGPALQGLLYC